MFGCLIRDITDVTSILQTTEQSIESMENPLPFLSNGKNVYGVSDWNRRKSLDSYAAFGESCGVAAVWVIIGGTIASEVSTIIIIHFIV